MYEQIKEIYIGDGLHPVIEELSKLGTSIILAFSDLRRGLQHVGTFFSSEDIESITSKITVRDDVTNLRIRNYERASRVFPRLQIYGMEVYNAVINTFYLYSKYTEDGFRVNLIERQCARASIPSIFL